ncbi:MAG: hypothetical protein ACRCTJ_02260, partial [Brevinema sp.]
MLINTQKILLLFCIVISSCSQEKNNFSGGEKEVPFLEKQNPKNMISESYEKHIDLNRREQISLIIDSFIGDFFKNKHFVFDTYHGFVPLQKENRNLYIWMKDIKTDTHCLTKDKIPVEFMRALYNPYFYRLGGSPFSNPKGDNTLEGYDDTVLFQDFSRS